MKSDPSLVYHSYDQFTRITYELDREATVGVKLLSPGILDPNDPTAIVLQAPVLQATGEHTVTWGVIKGYLEAGVRDFGVVQIDAHADLRDAYEGDPLSHASPRSNGMICAAVRRDPASIAISRRCARLPAHHHRGLLFPCSRGPSPHRSPA